MTSILDLRVAEGNAARHTATVELFCRAMVERDFYTLQRESGKGFRWFGRHSATRSGLQDMELNLCKRVVRLAGPVRHVVAPIVSALPTQLFDGPVPATDGVFLVDLSIDGTLATIGIVASEAGRRSVIDRVFDPVALGAALTDSSSK